MIKPRLRDPELRPAAQRVLVGVLDAILRLCAAVHAVSLRRAVAAAGRNRPAARIARAAAGGRV